jgi:hypothetical protein
MSLSITFMFDPAKLQMNWARANGTNARRNAGDIRPPRDVSVPEVIERSPIGGAESRRSRRSATQALRIGVAVGVSCDGQDLQRTMLRRRLCSWNSCAAHCVSDRAHGASAHHCTRPLSPSDSPLTTTGETDPTPPGAPQHFWLSAACHSRQWPGLGVAELLPPHIQRSLRWSPHRSPNTRVILGLSAGWGESGGSVRG